MKLPIMILIAGCLLVASCKKLLQTQPPATALTEETVFGDQVTAIAAMNHVYVSMVKEFNSFTGGASMAVITGISGDEMVTVKEADKLCYRNQLSPAWKNPFWGDLYRFLYYTNAVIAGVKNPAINDSLQAQLTGEALFMRAFFHFYLVNLYGDVPVVTTTDARINNRAVRVPKDSVYRRIISDLLQAQQLLKGTYLKPDGKVETTERVRPNRWAATALLARAYLYTGAYAAAEEQANALLQHTAFYGLETLERVFLKNNRESIWQLQSITNNYETLEAPQLVLLLGPGTFFPVYMSTLQYNSFEKDDGRKTKWTGLFKSGTSQYAYPYKYKLMAAANATTKNEYLVVLRLAEQYLIRAEARARQGNLEGAVQDINVIRQRAGLPALTLDDEAAILLAIEQERRVELFSEWCHRWFDLKRTGRIDAVMQVVTPLKGGEWKSFQQDYPVSLSELMANPKLVQTRDYH